MVIAGKILGTIFIVLPIIMGVIHVLDDKCLCFDDEDEMKGPKWFRKIKYFLYVNTETIITILGVIWTITTITLSIMFVWVWL